VSAMAFQVPNGSGSLDRSKLVFDMIAIRKSRGGFNLIDVEAFLRIPLSERVALVQDDKLRFLSGEEIVPVRGALLSLEAARLGAREE
jgi:hypothetical protein